MGQYVMALDHARWLHWRGSIPIFGAGVRGASELGCCRECGSVS